MSESKIINSIYFHFFLLFYFLFILFSYLELRIGVCITLHITVTYYGHISQKNKKGSRIIILYHMSIACNIHVL